MLSAIHASVAFIGRCGASPHWDDETRRGRRVYKKTLKWNFVFVRLASRRCFRRCAGLPAFSARVGRSAWRPSSEQLHVLGHHAQARSLLPGLLVVPTVHLQPPFNANRSAFFQVLAGDLRCSSPEGDIDKRDFLALFGAVGGIRPILRDTEFTRAALLRSLMPSTTPADWSTVGD